MTSVYFIFLWMLLFADADLVECLSVRTVRTVRTGVRVASDSYSDSSESGSCDGACPYILASVGGVIFVIGTIVACCCCSNRCRAKKTEGVILSAPSNTSETAFQNDEDKGTVISTSSLPPLTISRGQNGKCSGITGTNGPVRRSDNGYVHERSNDQHETFDKNDKGYIKERNGYQDEPFVKDKDRYEKERSGFQRETFIRGNNGYVTERRGYCERKSTKDDKCYFMERNGYDNGTFIRDDQGNAYESNDYYNGPFFRYDKTCFKGWKDRIKRKGNSSRNNNSDCTALNDDNRHVIERNVYANGAFIRCDQGYVTEWNDYQNIPYIRDDNRYAYRQDDHFKRKGNKGLNSSVAHYTTEYSKRHELFNATSDFAQRVRGNVAFSAYDRRQSSEYMSGASYNAGSWDFAGK